LGAVPRQPLQHLTEPVIVLCHSMSPSETAGLNREFVRGFCTETGAAGGHTAIVAKGLELPAVVGIGPFLDSLGSTISTVIVDGDQGRVIIDPDDETLRKYEESQARSQNLAMRLSELRDMPAETTDSVRISLSANIEFPHEVRAVNDRGADGIGLYRTEFLYLASDDEPSEEDHFQAYRAVVQAMEQRPVVIRSLDLGADKIWDGANTISENNPFLGLRSIRLALRDQNLFRPQLRAVLRAAVFGDVRLMFPLVTTLQELRAAKMLLKVVAEDLEEEGVPHRSDIPIGMMVETPAAVLLLDRFAKEIDFLSIGTNDLVQYALAVDRSNQAVADLYQSVDPAVLRLIEHAVAVSETTTTPLSICGQMCSNPARALLLVGMGLRSLSVPAQNLPRVKKAIRSVSIAQCQEIANRAAGFESASEVDLYLQDRLNTFVPELAASG
ncbi:MAG: phosphoenolpyruvate--protein phosphotransferase, partial [Planctomycetota bacterium]